MKNKTKKEIQKLESKIIPIQNRINEIKDREILEVQRPRLVEMVGYCLRSTYDKNKKYYGKVLELIENKNGGVYFILEICHITAEGNPYMHLDSVSPYLNKEWWDAPFPVAGWEVVSEKEYQQFKMKIKYELTTQNSLRAWIKKLKY